MESSEIPNTILIDFHGCLTDGSQSISHNGEQMFEHVHTRDVRAIRELSASGFHVVIATASSNPIVKKFAERVGAEVVVERDKSKLPERFGDYMAIGDDAWDVPMLKKARIAFCPADADVSVKNVLRVIPLQSQGGRGCIAEILSILNDNKNNA